MQELEAIAREQGCSSQELFLHTCDQAKKARNIDLVCVATDDDQVEAAAKRAGYKVVRTSEACRTGSERCAEAARFDGQVVGRAPPTPRGCRRFPLRFNRDRGESEGIWMRRA